jgi:hypothetical protein
LGDVMLTVRLATAPDPAPMPGLLRVELEGLTLPIAFPMPAPGTALVLPPIPAPVPAPNSFTMTIAYYLDSKRVGAVVKGVADGDALHIFAARLDKPILNGPGVLYVGNIFHADLQTTKGLQTTKRNCSVHCEHSVPIIEECCVVCRDGNIVTETCC